MIKIITIGKKTEYDTQINDYIKRLKKPFDIKIINLPFSSFSNDAAREYESKQILSNIQDDDFTILLDERGKQIDNYELTDKLVDNKKIVIVIGGPYGVNEELRKRANFMWALGKLILPYEIVRLVLIEQIYRCQCISQNHPYHHK
ncbi:ribosomal RNA large subunit methyltransferase H [Bacilli bacterium]|nr:ribosomal RNA large subunit methyltransferase H [Bacilli bacterium]